MAPHYRKMPRRGVLALACCWIIASSCVVTPTTALSVIDICTSQDLAVQEVDAETFVLNCSLIEGDSDMDIGVYAPSIAEEFETCDVSNLKPLETRFPLKMTVEGKCMRFVK
jgi:hypothetical protein